MLRRDSHSHASRGAEDDFHSDEICGDAGKYRSASARWRYVSGELFIAMAADAGNSRLRHSPAGIQQNKGQACQPARWVNVTP